RRLRVLEGRGKVRYRVQRSREALDDLAEARRHAESVGDIARLADIVLTEATVLDWAEQYGESARRVAEARPMVDALSDPRLEARYYNGLARQYFREERMVEAVELYERATALAESHGDDETRITALLLMCHALIDIDR